jgi:hypothetical protein
VFSRLHVDISEFDDTDKLGDNGIILDNTHFNKLIMLCKMFPKHKLHITCDYDVVQIKILDSALAFNIMYNFDNNLLVNEPVTLRHTCTCNTEELRRLFELCHIEQDLTIELRDTNILSIKSEDGSCNGSLVVTDTKKLKKTDKSAITIPKNVVQFLINRLNVIKSKTVHVYLWPLIIEDAEGGYRVYFSDTGH